MADAATTLATPFAVIALVTFAKDLGLPTKFAGALAVVFGIGLSLADHYLAGTDVYGAIVTGAFLAAGGAGVYDTSRAVGKAIGGGGATGEHEAPAT